MKKVFSFTLEFILRAIGFVMLCALVLALIVSFFTIHRSHAQCVAPAHVKCGKLPGLTNAARLTFDTVGTLAAFGTQFVYEATVVNPSGNNGTFLIQGAPIANGKINFSFGSNFNVTWIEDDATIKLRSFCYPLQQYQLHRDSVNWFSSYSKAVMVKY